MNVHFERNANAKCDCTILNLTWMGKVPDELPEEEGWKLNRHNYYQEGWLATGNVRGVVGVTFTSSHCKKGADSPLRTNYNLRGHHSQVVLVKWNEPYQKLASCDSSGIIFVWIKYEGRWSVELINDRNTPVTNFAWSHDGRMALICYRDGFVLVGSVAGQRYWSSMLNLACTITCGVWTPDDQQVYFGTSTGQIIVMDVNGAMVSQVTVGGGRCITAMAWSCEKFKMDEGDDGDRSSMMHLDGRPYVVAVALDNGSILFLRRFDDPAPLQLDTGLQAPLYMEWSNAGELLAVAGWEAGETCLKAGQPPRYKNTLKFYTDAGVLLYVINIPSSKWPVTALTWGHNDKRLFVATGPQVHIAWVCRRIPSLSHLCRLKIHGSLHRGEASLASLPLPGRVQHLISSLFAQTIRCCVPEQCALRDFVSRPPRGHVRLHCTMIRHGRHPEEPPIPGSGSAGSAGTTYTLYLEYLGGLVPLLKGKRTSKIRPEFVIFDPRHDIHDTPDEPRLGPPGPLQHMPYGPYGPPSEEEPESDSSTEDGGCVSPRLGRRRHHHPGHRGGGGHAGRAYRSRYVPRNCPAELIYRDTLAEDEALVQVGSNIWGTRFKVVGLKGPGMPAVLGQITYKTSLLHLQPRQMTLCMTELRDEASPPIIFGLAPANMLNPKARAPAATAVAIAVAATAAGAASVSQAAGAPAAARPTHGPARQARPARPARAARPARPTEEGEPERVERPERGEQPERPQRPQRPERAERAERPAFPILAPPAGPLARSAVGVSSVPMLVNRMQQADHPTPYLFSNTHRHRSETAAAALAAAHAQQALAHARAQAEQGRPSTSHHPHHHHHHHHGGPPQGGAPRRGSSQRGSPHRARPHGHGQGHGAGPAGVPALARAESYTDEEFPQVQQVQVQAQVLTDTSRTSTPGLQSPRIGVVPVLVSTPVEAADFGNEDSVQRVKAAAAAPATQQYQFGAREARDAAGRAAPATSATTMPVPPLALTDPDCPTHGQLYRTRVAVEGAAGAAGAAGEDIRIPVFSIPSELNKIADLSDPDAILPDLIIPDVNIEDLNIPAFMDEEPEPLDAQHAAEINFIDDEVGEVRIGPVRSVSVGFLNEVAVGLQPKKRLVLTRPGRDQSTAAAGRSVEAADDYESEREAILRAACSKSISMDAFPGRGRACAAAHSGYFGPVLSATQEDDDSASERSRRRRSPAARWPPRLQPAGEDIRPAPEEPALPEPAAQSAQPGGLFVDMPLDRVSQFDVEPSEEEKSSPFAPLIAAEVPLQAKKKKTLFDLDWTGLDWPRRRKDKKAKAEAAEAGRAGPSEGDGEQSDAEPLLLPHSTPGSPAAAKKTPKRTLSSSPIRQRILNSPLLRRRRRNKSEADRDGDASGDEAGLVAAIGAQQYSTLESFQKAQLRQKLKQKKKTKGKDGGGGDEAAADDPTHPRQLQFIMHNKAPMWNENSQVYQLDFGGRVTQESAKNFQIEFLNKQVMQFGRIDANAYTLDFQYPFSALQAFAVALANITQRLK